MTEYLDINPLLIKRLQPRRSENQRAIQVIADVSGKVRPFDHVELFRNDEVPVHIHDFDATLADEYFATFWRRRLTDPYRKQSSRDARGAVKKIPAIWHGKTLTDASRKANELSVHFVLRREQSHFLNHEQVQHALTHLTLMDVLSLGRVQLDASISRVEQPAILDMVDRYEW